MALICFQRLSRPNLATLHCTRWHNRNTRDSFNQVLSYCGRLPSNLKSLVLDRDRTVSRRSEPSSRTALTGEQPDPWDLLQPQDAMSRHRTLITSFFVCRLYLHPDVTSGASILPKLINLSLRPMYHRTSVFTGS